MTAAAFPVPTGGVLVASVNAHVRDHVVNKLQLGRGPIGIASGGAEALAKLDSGNWQTLILDRQLPDLDAEELRGITERQYPGIRVMLLDPASAAPQDRGLVRTQTPSRSASAADSEPVPGMVGESGAMRKMYRMVRLVAQRNTTVLVTGPTGSGKELAARTIHRLSGRASARFAVLNCAAMPETTAVILRICYFSGRTETPHLAPDNKSRHKCLSSMDQVPYLRANC